MNVIECKNVNLSYGLEPVLQDLTFSIPAGDYVGLLGPNGSGKSTLLRVLLGLQSIDSGSVRVFGQDVATFRERSRIGYVPQKASQLVWNFPSSVEEVVLSGRTSQVGFLKRFGRTDRIAAAEAMELLAITDLKKKLLRELSGGQRQRVFIARAIAAKPDLLILDEPTTAIDPAVQHHFYGFLRQLNASGMTIIFVTHDVDVVTHESSTIICINGSLVCQLSSKEFASQKHLLNIYGDHGTHFFHGHTHKPL